MAPLLEARQNNNGGSNNNQAVDIITYVGIPLAVLGVIPTLYTCLKSLVTLRDIRKLLRQNQVTAITRSSLLSGIIEVEIQRKSLCPLNRDDDEYFKLGRNASKLQGGSWTQLNFRELTIGVKSSRLQYHDELCQPQAEIEFEALIAFLLDLGAIPDPQGWEDLRSSGLWTPAGTRLMMAPSWGQGGESTDEAVLFVTTSESSDGMVSLGMKWRADWGMRRKEDLPPYWMSICAPVNSPSKDRSTEDGEDEKAVVAAEANRADTENTAVGTDDDDELHLSPKGAKRISLAVPTTHGHKRSFSRTSARSSVSMMTFQDTASDSLRIRLGAPGLIEAAYEHLPTKRIKIPHLMQQHHNSSSSAPMWFASAATALGSSHSPLWSYTIPPAVTSLASRETIPGGVLVLLDLIPEDAVPTFRTPYDEKMAEHEEWVIRQKQNQRLMDQLHMTPQERTKAFHQNFMKDQRERIENMRRAEIEAERKAEEDLGHALGSQRVSISVLAEASRKYLFKMGKIREEDVPVDVVAIILWEMVRDAQSASELAKTLDMWKEWAEGGGMTKAHFEAVKENLVTFAYAACVLYLIREAGGTTSGNVVGDLQDCLRMWRRVRLG